jgi:hypothetical protein
MLLLQERVCLLERLQLRDLARGAGRWRLPCPPSQSPVARILAPLREHERVDRQRGGDGLDLNPRLLTESDRRQLELITVLPDRAWPWSRHRDTPMLLGGSVDETGASTPIGCSA